MTGNTAREHDDGGGPSPAASARMAGDLEVPRPLRLILTAGWNLTESVGLPVAAYAVAAWADGRVLFARTAGGSDPLVARLAAEVVALRQPATHHPGLHRFFQRATWLWAGVFLLLTVSLAVLMVTEPVNVFLLLTTAVTAALVLAGTGLSMLWFRSVLHTLGLRLRFAQPEPGS